MIPTFTDEGVLPAGVHPATVDEIEERFGRGSELRRVQMESVRWMVAVARRAGVRRIVLNGSFTTDIVEPNDVDCVLLIGEGGDPGAEDELRDGTPFLDVSLVRQQAFDSLVYGFFSTDRFMSPKGVVELIL